MNDIDNAKLHSAIAILRSLVDTRSAPPSAPGEQGRADFVNIARAYRASVEQREKALKNFPPLNPGWRILLELFLSNAETTDIAVSDISLYTNIALTTSLRYLSLLEDGGYIRREPCEMDKRRHFLRLTDNGREVMESFLESLWGEMHQILPTNEPASGDRPGIHQT